MSNDKTSSTLEKRERLAAVMLAAKRAVGAHKPPDALMPEELARMLESKLSKEELTFVLSYAVFIFQHWQQTSDRLDASLKIVAVLSESVLDAFDSLTTEGVPSEGAIEEAAAALARMSGKT